jgi:hypothetical protein
MIRSTSSRTAGRSIDIRLPQAQQMFATEDIQRPTAVFVVRTVERSSFLAAVPFHVGPIQIKHDLRAWLVDAAAEKQADRTRQKIQTASVSRSSSPPALLVMASASNHASTRRKKFIAKLNPDWLRSGIPDAVLLLALTVDWKLSYATDGGLLPIAREKSG